jgi:hypothetical protein
MESDVDLPHPLGVGNEENLVEEEMQPSKKQAPKRASLGACVVQANTR